MKKSERKSWQQKLIKCRDELLDNEQVNQSAASVVELDQTRVGRLSRMDAMQGQAISKDIQRRRKLDILRIDLCLLP